MQSIWQNKYVRFGLFGLGAIIALIVLLVGWQMMQGATSLQSSTMDYGGYGAAPAYEVDSRSTNRTKVMEDAADFAPAPSNPNGYVADLETYETTDYRLSARTRDFDQFCATLGELKSDDRFDFRTLNQQLNSCSATFYTEEQYTAEVLNKLERFSGVSVTRETSSVTRQRERLQDRTDILKQQLASVERTLQGAETQFDEIIDVARNSNNASELANAIESKLRMVDSLTQRKISLTSQINNALRQSQDLEERIGVVQFYVSAQPVILTSLNKTENEWQQAWKELKDRFTDTLIGLSAFLGIFLLFVFQGLIYLLITIVIIRLLWKFVKLVWRKL